MSESVILCEGYYDRAFWAGWLEYLGCTDPGAPSAVKRTRSPVLDPSGERVTGGHYAYHSPSGQFVRIVPCGGRPNILSEMRRRLDQRHVGPVKRLVVNTDADIEATTTEREEGASHLETIETQAKQFDSAAAVGPEEDVLLDGGETIISLIRWSAGDEPAAGIPKLQTLERLVCTALVAAYPNRGPAIQQWLDARPEAPAAGPKAFAWSHMAGWYAERGCDAFYRALWADNALVQELEARLRSSGAWRIAEALAA